MTQATQQNCLKCLLVIVALSSSKRVSSLYYKNKCKRVFWHKPKLPEVLTCYRCTFFKYKIEYVSCNQRHRAVLSTSIESWTNALKKHFGVFLYLPNCWTLIPDRTHTPYTYLSSYYTLAVVVTRRCTWLLFSCILNDCYAE